MIRCGELADHGRDDHAPATVRVTDAVDPWPQQYACDRHEAQVVARFDHPVVDRLGPSGRFPSRPDVIVPKDGA